MEKIQIRQNNNEESKDPKIEVQAKKHKKQKEIQTYKVMNIARSGWGKTYIAIEYLKKLISEGHLEPQRLVIFSSTIKTNMPQIEFVDWLQDQCNKKKVKNSMGQPYNYAYNNTAKEIKFKFIENLYNVQEQIKESGKQYHHWFILFDDMQGEDGLLYSSIPILKRLFLRGRHMGISIMFNLQTYRSSLDPVLKDQVSNVLIGDLNSEESKYDVIKQYCSGFDSNPRKSASALYEQYLKILDTNDGHGMLNIHCEKAMNKGRFEINLSGEFLDNLKKQ